MTTRCPQNIVKFLCLTFKALTLYLGLLTWSLLSIFPYSQGHYIRFYTESLLGYVHWPCLKRAECSPICLLFICETSFGLSNSIPMSSPLNASHHHLSPQILSYSNDCSSYSFLIMSFLITSVRNNFLLFQHSDKIYFEPYIWCHSYIALDSKLSNLFH